MTGNIPAGEGLRPLPAVPNLNDENERVAQYLKDGNVAVTLQEARATCAAGYGFSSWDDLVDYLAMCERHIRAGTSPYNLSMDRVDQELKTTLKDFNSRKKMAEPPPDGSGVLAAVATYVPRFYGASNAAMLNETLTEDEARLVVARQRRFMSWSALMEKIEEMKKYHAPEYRAPMPELAEVRQAVNDCDIDRFTRAFRERPTWFGEPERAGFLGGFVWDTIKQFILTPNDKTRALFDHLDTLGINVQAHLDNGLTGYGNCPIETKLIRGLLELGANPDIVPADGSSILEHAIVRYINGEAVDLIAARLQPRRAMWIAAGLGDMTTVLSYFGSDNRLTVEARSDRVDTNVISLMPVFARAPRPHTSDNEIIWEAAYFACLNGRLNVLKTLLDRGLPINYSPTSETLLVTAIRHQLVSVVELLLNRGADPHYKAWPNFWSGADASKQFLDHVQDKAAAVAIHAMMTR